MRDYSYKKIEPQTQTLVGDINRNIMLTTYLLNIIYDLSPGSPQSAEEDMAAEEKYTEGVVCGGLGDYREHPAGFQ